MKSEIFVIVEICIVQREWVCVFDCDLTIVENIKFFLVQIKDEIKDEYTYSENLLILDKFTQTRINPFIKASFSYLYHGITLQLY